MRNLGTTQDGDQNTYDRTQNPMLEQHLTCTTGLPGLDVKQPISNAEYATEPVASALAAALGGTVVSSNAFGTAVSSAPKRMIILPSGGVVAAGAIANILGNDATYPPGAGGNLNVKSGVIADLCGIPYQKGLAEALLAAAVGVL